MAARPMCTSSLGPGGSKTWTPPRRSPSGTRNATGSWPIRTWSSGPSAPTTDCPLHRPRRWSGRSPPDPRALHLRRRPHRCGAVTGQAACLVRSATVYTVTDQSGSTMPVTVAWVPGGRAAGLPGTGAGVMSVFRTAGGRWCLPGRGPPRRRRALAGEGLAGGAVLAVAGPAAAPPAVTVTIPVGTAPFGSRPNR